MSSFQESIFFCIQTFNRVFNSVRVLLLGAKICHVWSDFPGGRNYNATRDRRRHARSLARALVRFPFQGTPLAPEHQSLNDGVTWSLLLARKVRSLAGNLSPFTSLTSPVINSSNNNRFLSVLFICITSLNLEASLFGPVYILMYTKCNHSHLTKRYTYTRRTTARRTLITQKLALYTPVCWNHPERSRIFQRTTWPFQSGMPHQPENDAIFNYWCQHDDSPTTPTF